MTEHEMRVRLVEAMGWTDIQTSRSGQTHGIDPDGNAGTVPNPLDNDRDAARLRAWCVGQGWLVILACDEESASASIQETGPWGIGDEYVVSSDEPDPLRRERLAICRAVVQALDASEAGGGA